VAVNGEPVDVADGLSVADVLRELGYEETSVAVAVNAEFVARRNFAATALKQGDTVEVVAPLQGG
jgi:sulfur carrier protein